MPTYQELRSTYARLGVAELRDLARRPLDLTAQAQSAIADELSLRDVPTEYEISPSLARASTRTVSWHRGWLTIFQAWVTLRIAAFAVGRALLHPGFDWSTPLMLAIMAVPCVGLVLIANKHPFARRFWLGFLAVSSVAQLTTALVLGPFNWQTPIGIAINVAWYVYWLESRRVATEFGGVDEPALPADI